jgi:hypothetical protein
MSWKSRKRKAFLRYVESLKEVSIYLIDQYVLIDEFSCRKSKRFIDNRYNRQKQYMRYLSDDKIKSSLDFDNYFSPYLDIDVPFEKNKKKANILAQNALMQIGRRWNERLKELFPNKDYTIALYFHSESMEWYLDCYNGIVDIKENDDTGLFLNVVYLRKGH